VLKDHVMCSINSITNAPHFETLYKLSVINELEG